MSRFHRVFVAVTMFFVLGAAAANAKAADLDLYNWEVGGYVDLRTPSGADVNYCWIIYFGPETSWHSGGVAMNVSGCPVFGTHYDCGYHTLVVLDNAPYNSCFWVHRVGSFLIIDDFWDSAGNKLSQPGTFLWPIF